MPRSTAVRYVGLAGSLLLAVAAWLGGASSPWEPTVTPRTIFAGENGVALPLAWLLGTLLIIGAWVAGVRAAPTARWAYTTAALWAVPLLPFLPLGSYDAYSYACQGWQQAAGLDPYAGGVTDLGCPWASAVAPTWLSSPAPYGPVFLLLAALAVKVGGSLAGTLAALRVIAVLGVALIAVCLPALARRSEVPLGRAVWLTLACPLIPIHLISGTHNDAVMVGFLVAGLAVAMGSRRTWAAGLLLGLAIGVKATAVVVVPFAFWLALRSRAASAGRTAGYVRAGGELAAGVLVALAAASLFSGRGFGWITGLAGSGASVQWTSPPTAIGMTVSLFGPDAVPVTRLIGIGLLAVVLVLLWWRARLRDPLLHTGYALAATVLLAPVFHPWYAVWALPVLAATLHHHLRRLVVPCAVAAALCLPDGYNVALAVKSQGAILMTAFVIYLAWKALHEAKNRNSRGLGADRAVRRLPG
ncbi:polyprenol phosphomannose-dependent alpha 1,6 mannosyltransferase MptB [Actinoplanes sp. NPDC048988]|uniref:polyprenol phosphomannose-dependent alpha 1,6 mannosyltransferase MptB n=1 Tax=Actinoplanes sp. NPDC048988 TaxID=3363901 RepID=UPI0037142774